MDRPIEPHRPWKKHYAYAVAYSDMVEYADWLEAENEKLQKAEDMEREYEKLYVGMRGHYVRIKDDAQDMVAALWDSGSVRGTPCYSVNKVVADRLKATLNSPTDLADALEVGDG
jgi:hypothetical protein